MACGRSPLATTAAPVRQTRSFSQQASTMRMTGCSARWLPSMAWTETKSSRHSSTKAKQQDETAAHSARCRLFFCARWPRCCHHLARCAKLLALIFRFHPADARIASRQAHFMTIQEKNFWLDTVNTSPVQSACDLPDAVDVAVVGGGFCGLSAARALAKRGVKVAV